MSETNETATETTEISDKDKLLAMAKDLVELSIQSQKVLANASIRFSNIEEARLLALMTNEIIENYTETKEEK
jgi:hypothetical protein